MERVNFIPSLVDRWVLLAHFSKLYLNNFSFGSIIVVHSSLVVVLLCCWFKNCDYYDGNHCSKFGQTATIFSKYDVLSRNWSRSLVEKQKKENHHDDDVRKRSQ